MKFFFETKGVCLHREQLNDKKVRAIILTEQRGVLSVYLRQKHSISVGNLGEYFLKETQSGYYILKQYQGICFFLNLRNSYEQVAAATTICKVLLKFLWRQEESAKLYPFLTCILNYLDEGISPDAVEALFFMKLFMYEGSFEIRPICGVCHQETKNTYRHNGEVFCQKHAPLGSLCFSSMEEKLLSFFCSVRQKKALKSMVVDQEILEKIRVLFQQYILSI